MPEPRRFPPQIKFIIGNEACERFSYYGIRSILALYISTVLFKHLPAGEAFLIPVTTGHYSFRPTNGVSLQLQVAP